MVWPSLMIIKLLLLEDSLQNHLQVDHQAIRMPMKQPIQVEGLLVTLVLILCTSLIVPHWNGLNLLNLTSVGLCLLTCLWTSKPRSLLLVEHWMGSMRCTISGGRSGIRASHIQISWAKTTFKPLPLSLPPSLPPPYILTPPTKWTQPTNSRIRSDKTRIFRITFDLGYLG